MGGFAEGFGILGGNIDLRLAGRNHVHLVTAQTDRLNGGNDSLHLGGFSREIKGVVCLGILGDHDALGVSVVRKRPIDLLGDKGHEGMEQLQNTGEHVAKQILRYQVALGVLLGQTALGQFNVPVAEDIPCKIVDGSQGNANLEVIQGVYNGGNRLVVLGQNPLVLGGKLFRRRQFDLVNAQVHTNEAGRVPKLVGKVTSRLHFLVGEAHIVSGRVTRGKGEAQSVGSVLLDDLQRIDAVAERLGHLAALGVTHQTVNEHGVKGLLAHVLKTREDHTGYPEGNNVVAGHQDAGGIVFLQILGHLGPSHGGEGPQSRREPGVQHVLILTNGSAALGTGGDILARDRHLAAGVTVERGDAVTPPKLTGDTPVKDIVHPVEVILGKALGNKVDVTALHSLNGGLGKGLHLDEPLVAGHGLHSGAATVANAYVVIVRNHLYKITLCLKICNQRLAAGVAIHALVLAGIGIHGGVVVHHLDLLQLVTLTYQEVIGVVRGGDLYATGTKADLHIVIGNNGDLSANHGQNEGLADEVLHILILGVHGNGGITEHGLGTGGGNLHEAVLALDGILDMPEVAGLILVLDLGVGKSREASGTPVDDTVATVDQTLFIQVDEYVANRLGAALVKGKSLTGPVAGGAQLLELTRDASLVFILPLPYSFQELFASEIVAGKSLLLAESLLYLDLSGDAGVVGAGDPQGVKALHALVANQNVLKGLVQGMSHVKLTRYVGGRNDHREMLGVVLDVGGKIPLLAPVLVNSVLKLAGGVGFGQLVVLIHKEPPNYFI